MSNFVPVQTNLTAVGQEPSPPNGIAAGSLVEIFAALLSGVIRDASGGMTDGSSKSGTSDLPPSLCDIQGSLSVSDSSTQGVTKIAVTPRPEKTEIPAPETGSSILAKTGESASTKPSSPKAAKHSQDQTALMPQNGSFVPPPEMMTVSSRPTTTGRSSASEEPAIQGLTIARDDRSTLPPEPQPTPVVQQQVVAHTAAPGDQAPSPTPELTVSGRPGNARKSTATDTISEPIRSAFVPPAVSEAASLGSPGTARPSSMTAPAAPADQVAPALVAMVKSHGDTQSVVIHLQPADLGQVLIRIDRTAEGVAHVGIIADRPETLQLLQRDEPRLQQALDQAGVLSEGRSVSFQVSADQVGPGASRPDSMASGFGHAGQGQNGGTWREHGDSRDGFAGDSGADHSRDRPRWLRAGLDITA